MHQINRLNSSVENRRKSFTRIISSNALHFIIRNSILVQFLVSKQQCETNNKKKQKHILNLSNDFQPLNAK